MRVSKKALLAADWLLMLGSILVLVVVAILVQFYVTSEMQSLQVIETEVAYQFPRLYVSGFLSTPLEQRDRERLGMSQERNPTVRDVFWHQPTGWEAMIGRYARDYVNATYQSVHAESTSTMHTYFQDFVDDDMVYDKRDLLILFTNVSSSRLMMENGGLPSAEGMRLVQDGDTGKHNIRFIIPQQNGAYTVLYFARGSQFTGSGQSAYSLGGGS